MYKTASFPLAVRKQWLSSFCIFQFPFFINHFLTARTTHGWQSRTADEYVRCLRFRNEHRQRTISVVRQRPLDKEGSADFSSAVRLCHLRESPNAGILAGCGSGHPMFHQTRRSGRFGPMPPRFAPLNLAVLGFSRRGADKEQS